MSGEDDQYHVARPLKSVTNGIKEKMVVLSLIYGVPKFVRGCLPLQQFGFNRKERKCISVFSSIEALL